MSKPKRFSAPPLSVMTASGGSSTPFQISRGAIGIRLWEEDDAAACRGPVTVSASSCFVVQEQELQQHSSTPSNF